MSQFNCKCAKCKGSVNVPEDPELIALNNAPGTVINELALAHEEDLEATKEADPEQEASDDWKINEINKMKEEHPKLVLTVTDIHLAHLVVKKICLFSLFETSTC